MVQTNANANHNRQLETVLVDGAGCIKSGGQYFTSTGQPSCCTALVRYTVQYYTGWRLVLMNSVA